MTAKILPFPDRFNEEGTRWEPFVTETAVARFFNVSTRTVRRWRNNGCPSRNISGSRRYRLSEVEQWHERRAS